MGNWYRLQDGTYAKTVDQKSIDHSIVFHASDEMEKGLSDATKKISIVARHEAQHVAQRSRAAQYAYKIAVAGLKAIPVVGGFFGLAAKVLNNPFGGAWEVARSNYGNGAFNLTGEHHNGVSSALTVDGAKGYNLATGSPTLFQSCHRMKREQAEAELMQLAKVPGINELLSQGSTATVGTSNALADIRKLSASSSLHLLQFYRKIPAWYEFHALASLQVVNLMEKDGVKDLVSGNLLDDYGRLITGSAIDEIPKSKRYALTGFFGGSSLYDVLKELSHSKAADFEAQLRLLNFTEHGTIADRVHACKAKFIAYYPEMKKQSIFAGDIDNYVTDLVKRLSIPEDTFPTGFLSNAPGLKFAIAASFTQELLSAYFGSTRIDMLPATEKNFQKIAYALSDCALCISKLLGSFGTEGDEKNLFQMLQSLPPVAAFLSKCDTTNYSYNLAQRVLSLKTYSADMGIFGFSEFMSYSYVKGRVFTAKKPFPNRLDVGQHKKVLNFSVTATGYSEISSQQSLYNSTYDEITKGQYNTPNSKYNRVREDMRPSWEGLKGLTNQLSQVNPTAPIAAGAVLNLLNGLMPILKALMNNNDMRSDFLGEDAATFNKLP